MKERFSFAPLNVEERNSFLCVPRVRRAAARGKKSPEK